MTPTTDNAIRQEAEDLARENMRTGPGIKEIWWFPDNTEVRLVEVEDDLPRSPSEYLEPFYFNASPEDNLPAPSCVALIRPDEFGKLRLPEGWGDWKKAVKLEID